MPDATPESAPSEPSKQDQAARSASFWKGLLAKGLSAVRSSEARRRAPFEIVFALCTIFSASPLFVVRHLPLQDLPQHMAAIALLRRYAFDAGLREYFELALSRTQYLLVYLLGIPLSVPLGVEHATRLLVAATIVATPYALRFVARRTGADERLACLVWPFAFNPQMMYGFLNFLMGIPLALFGIGLFVDTAKRATKRRQMTLAGVALAAFFSHVIAYGILGLGVLLQLEISSPPTKPREVTVLRRLRARVASLLAQVGSTLRAWPRQLAFLAPSLIAVGIWLVRSPARDPAVAAGGVGGPPKLLWPNPVELPAQFLGSILNISGEAGPWALIAWGVCLLALLALWRSSERGPTVDRALSPKAARVAWLPCICAALYLFGPESYGWIWPIHTRFSVAMVLLLPLAIGRLRMGWPVWIIVAVMMWASAQVTATQVNAFSRWEQDELGDLEEALANAKPGRRLVALVPPNGSAHLPSNVPLLHSAAYYQIRGGNVATFSMVDFPQSPIRYREDGPRPQKLPPRWEWQTSLRVADPTLSYYDYVLVRVGYGETPPADRYRRVYHGRAWSLYERIR